MWDKWRDAAREGVDRWGDVLADIAPTKPAVPVERILGRYMREHRGNPEATLLFAAEKVGPAQAEAEARRYTAAMEALLQSGG